MAGISGSAPREPKRIASAFASLISVAFSELRRDLRELLRSRWDEAVRRRAEELSGVLAQACQRQGLEDLASSLRAVHNLARLPKASALPVLPALCVKLESLLKDIGARLPDRSARFGV